MARHGDALIAIPSRTRRRSRGAVGAPEPTHARRPLWCRCALAIQALWLALALMDTGALRPYCPMHDGLAPAAAHSAGHAAAMPHMAGMGHSGAPEPQPGHAGGCPCLGDCASAAAVPMPTAPAADWALAGSAPSSDTPSGDPLLSPRLPSDHFLPFPHAPPLA